MQTYLSIPPRANSARLPDLTWGSFRGGGGRGGGGGQRPFLRRRRGRRGRARRRRGSGGGSPRRVRVRRVRVRRVRVRRPGLLAGALHRQPGAADAPAEVRVADRESTRARFGTGETAPHHQRRSRAAVFRTRQFHARANKQTPPPRFSFPRASRGATALRLARRLCSADRVSLAHTKVRSLRARVSDAANVPSNAGTTANGSSRTPDAVSLNSG